MSQKIKPPCHILGQFQVTLANIPCFDPASFKILHIFQRIFLSVEAFLISSTHLFHSYVLVAIGLFQFLLWQLLLCIFSTQLHVFLLPHHPAQSLTNKCSLTICLIGIISLKQPTISTLGLSQNLSNPIDDGWVLSNFFFKKTTKVDWNWTGIYWAHSRCQKLKWIRHGTRVSSQEQLNLLSKPSVLYLKRSIKSKMSDCELCRFLSPSVFLGLRGLPEVEAQATTSVLSQLWPPTSLGCFGSLRKVATPHRRALLGPGDRKCSKPSLSLKVPSMGSFNSPVLPEISFCHNPTIKFALTLSKGTTLELTYYPTASKGWDGEDPKSHQHCKTVLHLLLGASKEYYVLMSCCIIN